MRWNRHPSRTGVLLVLSLLLAGGLQALAQPATPAKPAAEVNGQPITEEEIDKAIAGPLAKLQEQIYTLRQQRLEAAIRNRLLAQEAERRGLSVSKLLDTEVMSKVGVVTEEEVEGFYQANKARIGNANEAEIRDRIRSGLQGQKIAVQREAFVQSLRKSATVTINLQAPPVTRVEVPIDGAPAKGGANAHEAARCADEQGKFWAYHDVLFDKAPRTSANDLQADAREVGLDLAKFDQCVASTKAKEVVSKDIDEGARLGVTGTPAFFINGELLSGAQPLESFVRVVERALAQAR